MLEAIAGHDPADPTTVDAPVPAYRAELGARHRGAPDRRPRGALRVGHRARRSPRRPRRGGAARRRPARPRGGAAPGARRLDRRAAADDAARGGLGAPAADAHAVRRLRPRRAGAPARGAAAAVDRVRHRPARPPRAVREGARPCSTASTCSSRPAFPILPPRIGEADVEIDGPTMPYRLSFLAYQSPWSCLGLPALSAPAGFHEGMPVSLAVVGPRLGESTRAPGGPRAPAADRLAHAATAARDHRLRRRRPLTRPKGPATPCPF